MKCRVLPGVIALLFISLAGALPTAGQPLNRTSEWYASTEAIRIADNVLLYQHDNGGWEKNQDLTRHLNDADRAVATAAGSRGETTIDNGATYTQLRYLALVYRATGQARFRDAVVRGIDFLLEAQYPEGGWPQFYPIKKGYYEHVTFNDGAMIGVMRLLRDVARGKEPFTFVDSSRRKKAGVAIGKGLEVILKSQIRVGDTLTAWCAQHDRQTLLPAKARSYELPSLSGSESVGIVRYLMEIDRPSPAVVEAVQTAVTWMDRVRITGIRQKEKPDASLPRGYDRIVVADTSAPPLWARFYEIGTNRPFFCGRDGVVRYSLAEIEHERRIGYSWLGEYATELLKTEYPRWQQQWAPGKNVLDKR